MANLRNLVRRTPVVREIAAFAWRCKLLMQYSIDPLHAMISWLLRSRETTNFTYDLSELNKRHLAALISSVTGKKYQEIIGYVRELTNDALLRDHIRNTIVASEDRPFADLNIRYGRRLGWYALARALRPRIVIETGVDKGMGSCVLAAALMKNAEAGYPGHYYGTDLNPRAGYLLSGMYAPYGDVLFGDSIECLRKLTDVRIDLFINDSDHSSRYEAREYACIATRLDPGAFVLGDNSRTSAALLDFALATGREFIFFREEPARHWYPGAGIGMAFRRRDGSRSQDRVPSRSEG